MSNKISNITDQSDFLNSVSKLSSKSVGNRKQQGGQDSRRPPSLRRVFLLSILSAQEIREIFGDGAVGIPRRPACFPTAFESVLQVPTERLDPPLDDALENLDDLDFPPSSSSLVFNSLLPSSSAMAFRLASTSASTSSATPAIPSTSSRKSASSSCASSDSEDDQDETFEDWLSDSAPSVPARTLFGAKEFKTVEDAAAWDIKENGVDFVKEVARLGE